MIRKKIPEILSRAHLLFSPNNEMERNEVKKRRNKLEERLFDPLDQVSISSTFYEQIFRMNVISAAFSSYVLALAKNSYYARI